MATFEKIVSLKSVPTNKYVLWLDTSVNPPVLKSYIQGKGWVAASKDAFEDAELDRITGKSVPAGELKGVDNVVMGTLDRSKGKILGTTFAELKKAYDEGRTICIVELSTTLSAHYKYYHWLYSVSDTSLHFLTMKDWGTLQFETILVNSASEWAAYLLKPSDLVSIDLNSNATFNSLKNKVGGFYTYDTYADAEADYQLLEPAVNSLALIKSCPFDYTDSYTFDETSETWSVSPYLYLNDNEYASSVKINNKIVISRQTLCSKISDNPSLFNTVFKLGVNASYFDAGTSETTYLDLYLNIQIATASIVGVLLLAVTHGLENPTAANALFTSSSVNIYSSADDYIILSLTGQDGLDSLVFNAYDGVSDHTGFYYLNFDSNCVGAECSRSYTQLHPVLAVYYDYLWLPLTDDVSQYNHVIMLSLKDIDNLKSRVTALEEENI